MAATTLSAKEVARDLGTDARTFRKFLREVTPKEEQPGQGGRWTFTSKDVAKLKKQFGQWSDQAARTKAAKEVKDKEKDDDAKKPSSPTKGKKRAKLEEAEEIPSGDEPLDLDDLDGPTEEELENLEVVD